MNSRERGVCDRVRLFREHLKWTQSELANAIGIRRSKLLCIEYGHTPLRYQTGVDLCSVFDVNGEWLLTGKGEIYGSAPGLWIVEFPLEKYGKKLFTEVYDLNPKIFIHVVRVFGLSVGPTPGFDAGKYLQARSVQWFKSLVFKSPAEAESFARSVNDFAEEQLQNLQRGGDALPKHISKEISEQKSAEEQASTGTAKNHLTDSESPVKQSGVKAQLPSLLARLNRATEETGKMSALADFLGKATGHKVPLASVSRWLSGKREPGGEITLKLLQWVEQQERQK